MTRGRRTPSRGDPYSQCPRQASEGACSPSCAEAFVCPGHTLRQSEQTSQSLSRPTDSDIPHGVQLKQVVTRSAMDQTHYGLGELGEVINRGRGVTPCRTGGNPRGSEIARLYQHMQSNHLDTSYGSARYATTYKRRTLPIPARRRPLKPCSAAGTPSTAVL